ncbi:polysaccharide deacetylase family protein [uncultured Bartonella sp.]|uniref:polysaccharide deacetylase family protein n=1 Tax=uncultured Bartonella sp. TaxID=104108 RepID=UPI002607A5F3|nr:polysaccharide deacetylase family protein [uncultured Bartonella sp.]
MPVPILLYHHIGTPPRSGVPGRSNYVTIERFASQMNLLRRLGFQGLSLRQAIPYIRGQACGKVAAITFDDGFLSVYRNAMPILDDLGFSATNFFVSSRMGLDNAWDNEQAQRDRIMTFDDMRNWAAHGHEVGGHTLDHLHLKDISIAEAERQIVENKRKLEEELGDTLTSFAYPYGDENRDVRAIVKNAGYKFAVTTKKARANGNEDDFELPRHSIRRNDTILHFLAKCLWR